MTFDQMKEQARSLPHKELVTHASVSTDNRHKCRDCFTCAAVEVLVETAADDMLDALRASLWIADCAIDADVNGRKAAGCYRDGIKYRVAQIRHAIAKAEGRS